MGRRGDVLGDFHEISQNVKIDILYLKRGVQLSCRFYSDPRPHRSVSRVFIVNGIVKFVPKTRSRSRSPPVITAPEIRETGRPPERLTDSFARRRPGRRPRIYDYDRKTIRPVVPGMANNNNNRPGKTARYSRLRARSENFCMRTTLNRASRVGAETLKYCRDDSIISNPSFSTGSCPPNRTSECTRTCTRRHHII